jgi:hypothetical protein
MDRQAIDAIFARLDGQSPNFRLTNAGDSYEGVLVPPGYSFEIPCPPDPTKRLPTRNQQEHTFDDADSLIAYVNRYSVARRGLLVADIDHGIAKVTLDYIDPDSDNAAVDDRGDCFEVAACDHTAKIQLRASDEFLEWNKWEGSLHEQEDFILFLEENAADVIHPDAASLLEMARDFSAVTSQSFKSSRRLESGDRAFQFVSDTNVTSSVKVPQRIKIRIPIYLGEEPIDLELKFRYRAGEGGLKFGYEFHRIQSVKRAAFRHLIARVADETGLRMHYGRIGR